MLRNTSDGNELAMPHQCLLKEHRQVNGIQCMLGSSELILDAGGCCQCYSRQCYQCDIDCYDVTTCRGDIRSIAVLSDDMHYTMA